MKEINDGSGNQSTEVHDRVQAQFGAAASAYTTSVGHGDQTMLQRVVDLARPQRGDHVLDVATGAGHTALALAPHVVEVIAYDITQQMLDETARNAAARGLDNVRTRQGIAEELPFADASFEIVTVRHAPHHFADIQAAIREMARVVKPRGRLVVVDSRVPEEDAVASAFNHIEKLRDPSHVRSYKQSEWRAMVRAAGLRIVSEELDYYTENGGPMDFEKWTTRIKTPPEAVAELKRLLLRASPELTAAIKLEITGDRIGFCVPQITIVATKE
jgi:ubiquinone/menaquinone biosynthesis C-methylase UbiE